MLGVAAAQYGFALALRRPVAGGAMLGVGVGIAFLVDGTCTGPSGSPSPRSCCRSPSRAGARVATRRRRRRARRSRSSLGAAWPLALYFRAPMHLAAWWSTQSLGDFFWRRSTRRPPAIPRSSSRTCRGSRGPRCRSCSGRSSRAAAASTAGSRTPGVAAPGHAGARDRRLDRGHGRSAPRRSSCRCSLPLCAARGARDRHAEARLLGRARLVRHPHVRPPLAAHVVALVRRLRARHDARRSRGSSATPKPGYRPSFHWLAFGLSLFLTVLWVAAGAPRAPVESARRPQLGRRE